MSLQACVRVCNRILVLQFLFNAHVCLQPTEIIFMFSYVYCDYVRYLVILYNVSIGKYVCPVSGLSNYIYIFFLLRNKSLSQCGDV